MRTVRELRNVAAELRALKALSGGGGVLLELKGVLVSRRHVYFVLESFGSELRGAASRR